MRFARRAPYKIRRYVPPGFGNRRFGGSRIHTPRGWQRSRKPGGGSSGVHQLRCRGELAFTSGCRAPGVRRTVEFMSSRWAFARPRPIALATYSRWVLTVSAVRMNGSSSLTHAA